jgi:hypothetical protein
LHALNFRYVLCTQRRWRACGFKAIRAVSCNAREVRITKMGLEMVCFYSGCTAVALAEAVFLEVFLAFGSGRSDNPGSLPYFWDWLKRYSWKSSLLLVHFWRPPHRLPWPHGLLGIKTGSPLPGRFSNNVLHPSPLYNLPVRPFQPLSSQRCMNSPP